MNGNMAEVEDWHEDELRDEMRVLIAIENSKDAMGRGINVSHRQRILRDKAIVQAEINRRLDRV